MVQKSILLIISSEKGYLFRETFLRIRLYEFNIFELRWIVLWF